MKLLIFLESKRMYFIFYLFLKPIIRMAYHLYPKVVFKGTDVKKTLVYLLFPFGSKALAP